MAARPLDVPHLAFDPTIVPAPIPGKYTLVDHALFRVMKGAAGALMIEGEHDERIFSPMPAAGTTH